MERTIIQLIRKHPVAIVIGVVIVSIVTSIVVYMVNKGEDAAYIGDTFGIAAALLAGGALLAVAISIHDINENQESQQKQIDALAAIARAITDPIVVARVELRSDTSYRLFIENMGKSPAYDVQFNVEPKEGFAPIDDRDDLNLGDLAFIKHGFPVMAPQQKMSVWLADGGTLSERRKKGLPVVEEFTLDISYRCTPPGVRILDQKLDVRSYHYKFNFLSQQKTIHARGEVADEIHLFRKLIEKGMKDEGNDSKRFKVSVKKET